MIAGVTTAVLLCLFIGITAWAWSRRNQTRFDEASRLPLDDEFNIKLKGKAGKDGCCCKERAL